jgi:hypothetical protein
MLTKTHPTLANALYKTLVLDNEHTDADFIASVKSFTLEDAVAYIENLDPACDADEILTLSSALRADLNR